MELARAVVPSADAEGLDREELQRLLEGVLQWHGEYGMSLEFGSGSPAESRELLIRYDDGYPQERFRGLLRRAPTLADTVVEP